MALEYPEFPNYVVVDQTTERDSQWHEGTICYVRSNNTLYVLESGAWITLTGGGGGSGTVTDVSVTTANGISGSVATSTTTPAITLTLGAITPSSINSAGTITGSSLIKSGGTSSQFLKADGSVDTSTYFVLPALTAGSILFSNGSTIAQDNTNLFWDDTNKFLGLGTSSPGWPLTFTGTDKYANSGGVEAAVIIDNTITTAPTAAALNNFRSSITVNPSSDPGTKTYIGVTSVVSVVGSNSTLMANAAIQGSNVQAIYAGTGSISSAQAYVNAVTHSGTGTITNVQGGALTATLSSTGQATTVRGFISSATVSGLSAGTIASTLGITSRPTSTGGSTITSMKGLDVSSWGITSGTGTNTNTYGFHIGAITNTGTMTNTYGIRVDAMTGAGTHTNVPYGFYQSSSGDYNFFTGKTGLGTGASIPLAQLYILSTTEQIRTGYDSSNYWNATTSSTGATVFDGVGSGARFDFSDDLGELTINPLQPVTKPHLKLTPRTNRDTPQVGAVESTGNDFSYTINGNTRKTVAFKENLVNSRTVVEFVTIATTTGVKQFLYIPYNASITGVQAFSDVSGSVVVDIYKQPYATFSPTLETYTAAYINKAPMEFNSRWLRGKIGRGNFTPYRDHSITGATTKVPFVNWAFNPFVTSTTPITLSSTTKYQDTTLSGWDTQVKAGDILCFVVNSVTTITRLDISLTLLKD